MAYILNEGNPELVISLTAPYTNISKVLSYEDVLEYDFSIYHDLDKFFRYSFNDINYSNWIELTNDNLKFIDIPMMSEFWIEYKYVLNDIEEDQSIEFKSIALEIVTQQQKILKKDCKINPSTDDCCVEKNAIVEECCPDNLFNPYDIQNALNVYEPIIKVTSNIFGFEVEYHKTNPNLNTKDVILGEYSVYNVEAKCNLKVLIPDNTLPTKELQFESQDGVALPDVFEIHIVRSVFEDAFGEGAVPRMEDYLYFPYLKRIYSVNSIMVADENPFNTANYYRVNLVDYAQKVKIIDIEGISDDLNEKAESYEEIFKEEIKDEIEKVVKPQQYETISKKSEASDIIRAYIEPKVIIREHNIVNPNTYQVVSQYYYDFSQTLTSNEDVIKYNYSQGLPNDFAFTYMIQPQKALMINQMSVDIKKIEDTTGTYSNDYYNGIIVETHDVHGLNNNDLIYIKNSSYYNGINLVSKILDSKRFIINKTYKGFNGGAITKSYEKQIIIENTGLFSIILINGNVVINIEEKLLIFPYSYPLKKWSYSVLNFSNTFKQVALYVYDEEFKNTYRKINLIDPVLFEKADITIKSGNYYLSNIRLFEANIEEEQHTIVLSQNIVIDSHLALIIDNAQPQVRLKQYENNR
jgi:hypothetical protein